MTEHASGVRALLAPSRPDQAASVSVELLRDVYSTLRATYDYVIVDTPPGFTPEVIATIDSASDVCLIGMLDSLSLKNTKLGLETLDLMGFERERLHLVLNRAGTRVGITNDDVRTIIGREPDVLIPSDREIPRALNEGQPIVLAKPGSEAARSFGQLAARFIDARDSNGAGPARRRSLFARKG
jgi:pilus assembly protein CpaE